MIEIVAKISSKHQVTLPADVRRRLGVGADDKIAFVLDDQGSVELRPVRYSLESVLGSIKALTGETADLDREIAVATAEEIKRTLNRHHVP